MFLAQLADKLGQIICDKAVVIREMFWAEFRNLPAGEIAVDAVKEGRIGSHLRREGVKKAGGLEQHIHALVDVAHKDHRSTGRFFFLATGKGTGGHIVLHDLNAIFVLELDTGHLIKGHAVPKSNQTYGFASGQLAAPQANAMAAVIDPLMNGVGAPWALYAIGAVIAVILTFCGIPAIAFALGMFIPLELNMPLLVGGIVSWYVSTRSKNAEVNRERNEKGTLIASGFIAGGALMGVVSALLRFFEVNLVSRDWMEQWLANPLSEICSLIAYICLILYFVFATKTKEPAK